MDKFLKVRDPETGEVFEIAEKEWNSYEKVPTPTQQKQDGGWLQTADKYLSYAINPLTFGFGDEIVGALASKLTGNTYKQERDKTRNYRKQVQEEAPLLAIAGDVGLGIASGGALNKAIGAVSKAPQAVRTIASIIGEGALQGAGDATEGERLKSGAIGAGLGAVATGVGKGVGGTVDYAQHKLSGSLSYFARLLKDAGFSADEVVEAGDSLARAKNVLGKDLTVMESLLPANQLGKGYQTTKVATALDSLMESSPQGSELFGRFVRDRQAGAKDRLIQDLQQAYQLPGQLASDVVDEGASSRVRFVKIANDEANRVFSDKYKDLFAQAATPEGFEQKVGQIASKNRLVADYLGEVVDESGEISPKTIHQTRKLIDEGLQGFREYKKAGNTLRPSDQIQERKLLKARTEVDNLLQSAVPGLKKLDQEYSKVARVTKDLQKEKIKKIVTTGKGSPAERLIRNDAEVSKFYNSLPKEVADSIIERVNLEDKMFKIAQTIGGNSKTARALQSMQDNADRTEAAFDMLLSPRYGAIRALKTFTNANPLASGAIMEDALKTGNQGQKFLYDVAEKMMGTKSTTTENTQTLLRSLARSIGGQ